MSLNGREYLARCLLAEQIGFVQHDNCFTHIADPRRAQACLDRLVQTRWAKVLAPLAERVNPWLGAGRPLQLRPYYWTVRQAEWATDVLFADRETLARLYPLLVRHAVAAFNTSTGLRFLGRRVTCRFSGEVRSELAQRVEGVRVRHWVEENSIKMYDQAGQILRIEVTINSPKRFRVRRRCTRKGQTVRAWVPMRKGVVDVRRLVQISQGANERYLDALAAAGDPVLSAHVLDPVSRRVRVQDRPFRALRPIAPDETRVFAVVLAGQHCVQGFRNRDRQRLFQPAPPGPQAQRRVSARVSRLLGLLQAHGLIYRVTKTNYYRVTQDGHLLMSTAIRFRLWEVPILAA